MFGINAEKSNFMNISSQFKVSNLNTQTSTLNLDGKVLHPLIISHILGFILTKNFVESNMNQLCKKLGKKIGALSRLRNVLPKESLILIYMQSFSLLLTMELLQFGDLPLNIL